MAITISPLQGFNPPPADVIIIVMINFIPDSKSQRDGIISSKAMSYYFAGEYIRTSNYFYNILLVYNPDKYLIQLHPVELE